MFSALSIEVTHMNQADTAWMLVATASCFSMTPALAFFYGGLVRSKNALNTMMMSFLVARLCRRVLGALATRWHSTGRRGSATCQRVPARRRAEAARHDSPCVFMDFRAHSPSSQRR